MARIVVKTPPRLDWLPSDRLQLVIGTENAASLAESTPAGGRVVKERSPWPDGGASAGGWGFGAWGEFVWGAGPVGLAWGAEGSVWGYGAWPFGFPAVIVIEHVYTPTDKCASLPVGLRIIDQAGNVSDVAELVVQIADPPRGARNLATVATGVAGTAKLTWTESPDLNAA